MEKFLIYTSYHRFDIIKWMEENVGPRITPSVIDLRLRYIGAGWDIRAIPLFGQNRLDKFSYEITINDKKLATMFLMRFS